MSKKITWNKIHKDFTIQHPRYAKEDVYWRPYDFGKILIYLKDGKEITYDYDTKRIKFLPDRWKK